MKKSTVGDRPIYGVQSTFDRYAKIIRVNTYVYLER